VTGREGIRVFLLDDHELVRRGLRDLLESETDVNVVGEASSADEALRRIPACQPNVAVLDVRLPGGSGIDVCREIRSNHPEIACLILTSFDDDDALFAAIMAGASGYVLKQVRGPALVSAVRTVAAGGTLFDPEVGPRPSPARRPVNGDNRLAQLTDQERTVLRLIGEGLTNRQIGGRMGLAEKTVKNYTSHLLAKLGLERRTQAAILATELRDRPPG